MIEIEEVISPLTTVSKRQLLRIPVEEVDVFILKDYFKANQVETQIHYTPKETMIVLPEHKVKFKVEKYQDQHSYVITKTVVRYKKGYGHYKFFIGKGITVIKEEVGRNKIPGFIINSPKGDIFWPYRVLEDVLKPVTRYDLVKDIS